MYIIRCICLWMILGLMACSGPVRIQKNLEVKPEIFPDYVDDILQVPLHGVDPVFMV